MLVTTPRLILREFAADDWQAVLDYQREPLYLRYNPWPEGTVENVQGFVARFIEQQQAQPGTKFQLAIILRADQRLIGNCGIRLHDAEPRKAEIGYELAPVYRGHGLAAEAAQAMVRFGGPRLLLSAAARAVPPPLQTAGRRACICYGGRRDGYLSGASKRTRYRARPRRDRRGAALAGNRLAILTSVQARESVRAACSPRSPLRVSSSGLLSIYPTRLADICSFAPRHNAVADSQDYPPHR